MAVFASGKRSSGIPHGVMIAREMEPVFECATSCPCIVCAKLLLCWAQDSEQSGARINGSEARWAKTGEHRTTTGGAKAMWVCGTRGRECVSQDHEERIHLFTR